MFEVVERWSAQAGFGFAAGRLFWVYGPGEASERLVPSMIRAAEAQVPFTLRHPKQVRDYIHVSDAGSAFAALLASDAQGAVNIASARGLSSSTWGTSSATRSATASLSKVRTSAQSIPRRWWWPSDAASQRRRMEPRYRLEDGIGDSRVVEGSRQNGAGMNFTVAPRPA